MRWSSILAGVLVALHGAGTSARDEPPASVDPPAVSAEEDQLPHASQPGPEPVAGAPHKHWAFRRVQKPPLPAVKDRAWPASPIDHFILAGLEAHELAPAPPADRPTLIRRATFDLVGLPPTRDQVEAFVNDRSPEAFAKVVDRLLASPHYGERWGRHWLDVARYADTKGYVYAGEERRYPFSYTYRDYVIRAFNDDLPYDRFLIEQIAADSLPSVGGELLAVTEASARSEGRAARTEERASLAAMGFLTLGRRFVNNVHDVIDDRLDVIFRGTQALTVGCARCHDHKFDPIPTRDYYSLYGVMAGATEKCVRLVASPEQTPECVAYAEELQKREAALAAALEAKGADLSDRLRRKVVEYLVAVLDAEKQPSDDFYVILSPEDLNPVIVRRWQSYLLHARESFHPVFGLWHALAAIGDEEFAVRAPAASEEFASRSDSAPPLNPLVAQAFRGPPPASMREVAERYGKLLADADQAWRDALQGQGVPTPASAADQSGADPYAQKRAPDVPTPRPSPDSLADPAWEELRQVLYAPDAPTTVPPVRISEIETFFDEATRVELNKLQARVDEWNLESRPAPPHALILEDSGIQRNPRVFVRGNPKIKGEEVPRQFLSVVSGDRRRPFQQGSGRLELARAIASPDNPLTARVMVNRVWLHHFGSGLVRTPSDFGTRSEPPSHPELLDYLAWRFIEEGWSTKKLHRLIMLSSTYQQASHDNPGHARIDPENRLLWRMNRRRLDFESLRDSLLAAAGRLDTAMGGRPVTLTEGASSRRRTVYGFVDRQNLPGVLRVFDFANPDQHSPERYSTTVPQQALFLLNSPFVVQQATALAARPELMALWEPAHRIRELYALVYQRAPTESELEIGLRFLAASGVDGLPGAAAFPDNQAAGPGGARSIEKASADWRKAWHYGHGEVDDETMRVKSFQRLSHFTGEAWQVDAGARQPYLDAEGGHAGTDVKQAAIRRWVAPDEGAVAITGAVGHLSGEGDGVRARIVSSRAGVLGTWLVQNQTAETSLSSVEVQPGDTLDFVVDCRTSDNWDVFRWAPVVRYTAPPAATAAGEWNAGRDFGQPLSGWERYAQALLVANEFVFVD